MQLTVVSSIRALYPTCLSTLTSLPSPPGKATNRQFYRALLANVATPFLLDFNIATGTIGGLSELLVTAFVVGVAKIVLSFRVRFV